MKKIIIFYFVFISNLIMPQEKEVNPFPILVEKTNEIVSENDFLNLDSFLINWSKLNGPLGGHSTFLKVLNDTIYAGMGNEYGRLFYSINIGNTWSPSKYKFNNRIYDIINQNDGSKLVSIGEAGISKSFDLHYWEQRELPNNQYRFFGKDVSERIFVGTGNGRIYQSSNYGLTWELSYRNDNHVRIQNFVNFNDSSIFTSTEVFNRSKPGLILKKSLNESNWSIDTFPTFKFERLIKDDENCIYVHSLSFISFSSDMGLSWQLRDPNNFFYGNTLYELIYSSKLIGAFGDETEFFGDGWGAAVSDDKGFNWRWT